MARGVVTERTRRSMVAAAAIAPVVAFGIAAGAGTASAAPQPSIAIASVGNGTFTVNWNSHDPKAPCIAHILSDGQPERLTRLEPAGSNNGSLPAGRTQVWVDCGAAGRSLTVSGYAPNGPINDILTLFSSGLVGFGIQPPF